VSSGMIPEGPVGRASTLIVGPVTARRSSFCRLRSISDSDRGKIEEVAGVFGWRWWSRYWPRDTRVDLEVGDDVSMGNGCRVWSGQS